jgi:DNA replication licensing factor MCM2
VRDVIDAEDEDEEGEDLFGPGIVEYGFFFVYLCRTHFLTIKYYSDYGGNELLDTYSNSGLDDEELFEPMSAAARRAAEAKMRQRDRMERGSRRGMRAATRSHAPSFFDSDDMGAEDDESELLSGTRARARRQYDERRDMDDMEGIGDVRFPLRPLRRTGLLYLEKEVPLEQLSDIKAKSIVEWIANDRVRRSIVKHFRQFLMTYVDDHGASVYGQRIRNLGESESFLFLLSTVS